MSPSSQTSSPRRQYPQRARQAMRQGDWERALEHWQTCLAEHDGDGNPAWHCARAHCLIKLGRHDAAGEALERLIEAYPGFAPGHAEMALLAVERRDWDLAAERWASCIRDQRDALQPWWLQQYALCLGRLRRDDEQERALLQLVERFPTHPQGHVQLALLAQRRGDWQRAEDWWHSAIELQDGSVEPNWSASLGWALMQQGRLREAAAVLEPLAERHPGHQTIRVRLAQLADRWPDAPRAERRWRSCIERFGGDTQPEWHAHLARAVMNQGRHTEALAILARAPHATAALPQGLTVAAQACFMAGDMEGCLRHARRLVAAFPRLDAGYAWAERALNGLERFAEAADHYARRPGHTAPRAPAPGLPAHFPPALVLPPLTGNGNDYSCIERAQQAFLDQRPTYRLPVSVVLPVYNRARLLANTLAALTRQTYPSRLIEVVVADDGSSDDLERVLDKYRPLLDLIHVHQEDRGFRAAAVRNLGVRAARHAHLILLDGEILPPPGLVEAYMSYLHVSDRAVLMGLREFVCSDGVSDDDIRRDPELIRRLPQPDREPDLGMLKTSGGRLLDRRKPVLLRSDNLRRDIYPFRYLGSGNLALPRAAFEQAGGFDEAFNAWGGEDVEFAYRLSTLGLYLIPLDDATGYHQEALAARGEHQAERTAEGNDSDRRLRQHFPLHPGRDRQGGTRYPVPKVSLCLLPGEADSVPDTDSIAAILGQAFTDLELILCDTARLPDAYRDDPRVRRIRCTDDNPVATALAAGRGMYLGLIDNGDVAGPGVVGDMVDLLDRRDVGLVLSPAAGPGLPVPESTDFRHEQLLCGPFPDGPLLFKRRDWRRTRNTRPLATDAARYDLVLRLAEVCDLVCLPRPGCRRRRAPAPLIPGRVDAVNQALARMGLGFAWQAGADPARPGGIDLHRRQTHVADPPAGAPASRINAFIAGSGRSGTTWLLETLNHDRSHGILFEPFRREESERLQAWRSIQYLRPDSPSANHHAIACQVLEANIHNSWLTDHNSTGIRHRWLAKDIRTNLCLKWLREQFPWIPTIYLLRHPCAVARSRVRTPWTWPDPRPGFLEQPQLMDDHLAALAPVLQDPALDPFEIQLVAWCVDNRVPLRQLAPGDALVVFYEDLCRYPEREFRRILHWLGRAYTPEIVRASAKPSSVSISDSAVVRGVDRVNHWRTGMDAGRLRGAMAICERFGLAGLYGDDGLPRLPADQVLGRFAP